MKFDFDKIISEKNNIRKIENFIQNNEKNLFLVINNDIQEKEIDFFKRVYVNMFIKVQNLLILNLVKDKPGKILSGYYLKEISKTHTTYEIYKKEYKKDFKIFIKST